MGFLKKCLVFFLMFCILFATCGTTRYPTIYEIPIVIHLYKGQKIEDIQKYFIESEKKLLDAGIKLKTILILYDSYSGDVYDVGNTIILNEKKISDQDPYLHIFFVKKLSNSKSEQKDFNPIGYNISWDGENFCSSFILMSDHSSNLTLSHEVGHHFGLDHTPRKEIYKRNIMYPSAISDRQFFNNDQKQKMRDYIIRRRTCS